MQEKVMSYYENYDEEGRLYRSNAHMTEYLTSIHFFDKLFPPNSHVLDACAGAGRYSFYLADKGYTVTACDLVEHNVSIIKSSPCANKLAEISVCDVLDMPNSWKNKFDIVLCMGALYHLQKYTDRLKAISECVRVCKQNGLVVLAYIVDAGETLGGNPYEDVFFASTFDEIEVMAKGCGLQKVHNISTDGILKTIGGSTLNEATDEEFQQYMEAFYLTCEDPAVIMAGGHVLWIGRRKA